MWKRRGGEGGGEGSRSKVCLFDRESTPETYRVWTRTGFGGGTFGHDDDRPGDAGGT